MNRDDAYPQELWLKEREHLAARQGRPPQSLGEDGPPPEIVGVALSGGGIRSATFCLGVFQALAQLQLVRRIDYVSTVSGGGYFGAFLCRLFLRRPRAGTGTRPITVDEVEQLLVPERKPPPPGIPDVLEWLRENGRYLSPNGAGDLLVGTAIALRNWVSIHVVLLSFALLVLLSGQIPRILAEMRSGEPADGFIPGVLCGNAPCLPGGLWWSPWLLLPLAAFFLWAVPLGWAYWMTGRWRHRPWLDWPVVGLAFSGLLGAALAYASLSGRSRAAYAGWLVVVIVLLTMVVWGLASLVARRAAEHAGKEAEQDIFPSPESRRAFELDRQRNLLSSWLKNALVATVGLLAFWLVDSVGQTLYVLLGARLFAPLTAAASAFAGFAAFAKRIATAFAGRANGDRLSLPLGVLAAVAAFVLVAVLLVSLSVLTHAVAWGFRVPTGPTVAKASPRASEMTVRLTLPDGARPPVTVSATVAGVDTPAGLACEREKADCPRTSAELCLVLIVCVVLLVFAYLFGRSWPFLNNSSLHSLYSARLTRAYLGASNPNRVGADEKAVTEVRPGDNIDLIDYWPPAAQVGLTGRPLHLVNVTINETVDGQSRVQQQDRKGTGLAVGPCAFSAGVRHHAVFDNHQALRRDGTTDIFPRPAPPAPAPYQVFAMGPGGRWAGGETLSLGAWVGISGAAFSTGLGARTSLGLSVLCGLANVRLGYWWDASTRPQRRRGPGVIRRLEALFRVQTYLLSELLSRFYGTSRPYWYLSDGGHFENMGGYELIRRRLARVVVVDAEADPEYTFDGLANLVRKARLDFGAEITFLSEAELAATVPDTHRRLFGTLEQLRRGTWAEEPVEVRFTGQRRQTIAAPPDQTRYSIAHAALARITFLDEGASGPPRWLLYIKPTMIGNEPADVVQYHREHPHFPQETTADQFFDEAQWESYRMLGYHIGRAVFGAEGLTVAPGTGAPTPPGPPPSATLTLPVPAQLIFGV